MIETLYAQLISDPNTLKVLCRTDKRNVTTETIYRDDCKIIIRHKFDDFLSCLIVKRQQAITKQIAKINLTITPIGVLQLYYKSLIDKNFEQFAQVFVNFRKLQKIKCGKVHKMFIIQTYCIYITTVLYNM